MNTSIPTILSVCKNIFAHAVFIFGSQRAALAQLKKIVTRLLPSCLSLCETQNHTIYCVKCYLIDVMYSRRILSVGDFK